MIYVCVRHFGWMLYSVDSKWLTLHANNFGDLPLHISYIRDLANRSEFPPMNPSFAKEILRYPFGPDLYNALYEILGVPLESHLFLVGIACSVASVTVLRWFGGWWALGAFFFSGGLIGWSALSGTPLASADLTQGVDWKNLFLSVFITQRGVLFALPASLLLIESTRRHFASAGARAIGGQKLSKNAMVTLGLVWGFLPLFHVHAFVITSLMMAGLAMAQASRENGNSAIKNLKSLLLSRMAIVAYLPATLFVLRSSDGLKKSSIVHIDPWWLGDVSNAGLYLLTNFGPWLLLPIALVTAILKSSRLEAERRRQLLLEFALYAGLWVFFYNVMIAPWSWDNIKVLIFPYLGFARLAYVVLDPLLPQGTKSITALALFFSGFLAVELSLAPPVQRGQVIYMAADLASMRGALSEVPQDSVFAAAPTHDHVLTYFGRLRAFGYEGHLWSHGVSYQNEKALLDLLMRGQGDAKAVAHRLGVTHILWGPAETLLYKTEPNFPATFKNVSRVTGYSIYEVPR